jgi:hypothetical protein
LFFRRREKAVQKVKPLEWYVDWLGPDYPIRLHIERRGNSRISFGKKALNMRISGYLNEKQKQEQIDKFLLWAKHTAREKGLPSSTNYRNYWEEGSIRIWEEDVAVQMRPENRKSVSALVEQGLLTIKVPADMPAAGHASVSTAVSRSVGKYFKQRVVEDLERWNREFIQKPINEVRLKQNHSNWGSCSNKGNINISTRLLLAPDEVIQYVFVHELCHLIHRNHSKRYWAKVEQVMPEYRSAEKWLKDYGGQCFY